MTNRGNLHLLDHAIQLLKNPAEPPSVRMNAILYMVNHFDEKCVDVFEEIIDNPDQHPDVRSASALALGKIKNPRSLAILMRHANSDDVTVRNYAVQSLGILGREEAIPVLIEALGNTNNTIFESAAQALGDMGQPSLPYLIELLQGSGKDDARCVAAWKLGELGHKDAIPVLIQAIREDANNELMALCIWSLGEIGERTPDVTDILHWALKHENPNISRRADLAIHKITRHIN
jgi:HEAT repeat protein